MSPSNKKKLFLLRKELDLIDNKMLNLLKIRANYVKRVLSFDHTCRSLCGNFIEWPEFVSILPFFVKYFQA